MTAITAGIVCVVLYLFSISDFSKGIFHLVRELNPGFIPLIFSSITEARYGTIGCSVVRVEGGLGFVSVEGYNWTSGVEFGSAGQGDMLPVSG